MQFGINYRENRDVQLVHFHPINFNELLMYPRLGNHTMQLTVYREQNFCQSFSLREIPVFSRISTKLHSSQLLLNYLLTQLLQLNQIDNIVRLLICPPSVWRQLQDFSGSAQLISTKKKILCMMKTNETICSARKQQS